MAFSNAQQKMNHKVGSAKARGRHDIRAYFAHDPRNTRIRPRIRGSRKSRLQSPRDLVYKVDIIRVSASLARFANIF